MTPEQAAWVREHVWPAIWRRNYDHIPGTFTDCACQKPRSADCRYGGHDQCAEDSPLYETVIQSRRLHPTAFAEPYAHPSPVRSGINRLAWVWLADRTCRSLCPRGCGQAVPQEPPPAPLALATAGRDAMSAYELVTLFDLETA